MFATHTSLMSDSNRFIKATDYVKETHLLSNFYNIEYTKNRLYVLNIYLKWDLKIFLEVIGAMEQESFKASTMLCIPTSYYKLWR